MMDQEVKELWVAALRSGEYVQGTSRLHAKEEGKKDTWCCLGVLCDLAIKAGVEVQVETRPDCTGECCSEDPRVTTFIYDKRDDFLPTAVQVWADLPHFNPRVPDSSDISSYEETLSDLNDNGNDFNTIADIIEANL